MSAAGSLQTIVVATDFSEHAAAARAWAERLARQHGAVLVLVHAFKADSHGPEFAPVLQGHHDAIAAGLAARLEQEAEKARAGGARVECELAPGSASAGVLAAAHRRHADLIVAGTRGRTSWKRLLLGSTAAALVRNASCPVVTVPATHVGPARPLRTALVATDFSDDAALAADAALRMLAGTEGERRLILVHAYDVPIEATYLPAPVLMEAVMVVDVAVKRTIEGLAATLRTPGVTVDAVAYKGVPPQIILEQAKSAGADLIAMGTHGRSAMDRLLLGSTAERVLGAATCPVLTVRLGSRT